MQFVSCAFLWGRFGELKAREKREKELCSQLEFQVLLWHYCIAEDIAMEEGERGFAGCVSAQ